NDLFFLVSALFDYPITFYSIVYTVLTPRPHFKCDEAMPVCSGIFSDSFSKSKYNGTENEARMQGRQNIHCPAASFFIVLRPDFVNISPLGIYIFFCKEN
ncbi:MAG: hypothetical protein LBF83_09835, partial [Spirochaetaceae bacterium]|nr:hypothetical protein [Spirochaetaceae bacterium]